MGCRSPPNRRMVVSSTCRIQASACGVITFVPLTRIWTSPADPSTSSACCASASVDTPSASRSGRASMSRNASADQPAAATATSMTSTAARRARDIAGSGLSAPASWPISCWLTACPTAAGAAQRRVRKPSPTASRTPAASAHPRSRTNGTGESPSEAKPAALASAATTTRRGSAPRIR